MSENEQMVESSPDTDWQHVWHRLHDSLGSKWTVHVLRVLADHDVGFNEMKRELDGITAKTLSKRLSELRCRGFVERHVEATTPPSTQYTLTPQGRTFVTSLRRLERLVDVVDCGACDGNSEGDENDESAERECAVVTGRKDVAIDADACC